MVNSEEGYQNLQRFLFGEYKVNMSLSRFTLDFQRTLVQKFQTFLTLWKHKCQSEVSRS